MTFSLSDNDHEVEFILELIWTNETRHVHEISWLGQLASVCKNIKFDSREDKKNNVPISQEQNIVRYLDSLIMTAPWNIYLNNWTLFVIITV